MREKNLLLGILGGTVLGGGVVYFLGSKGGPVPDPELQAQFARLSFVAGTQTMSVKKLFMIYKQWQYKGATWGLTVPSTDPAVEEATNDIIVDLGIDTNTGKAYATVASLGADSVHMMVDGGLVHIFPEKSTLGSQNGAVFNLQIGS